MATLNSDDRRDFAKGLSGFANSDGGILIRGVHAARDPKAQDSPDVVRGLVPVQDLQGFVPNLNNLLATITKPAAPGARNMPLPESAKSNAGHVLTYVPVGDLPPYRTELECTATTSAAVVVSWKWSLVRFGMLSSVSGTRRSNWGSTTHEVRKQQNLREIFISTAFRWFCRER